VLRDLLDLEVDRIVHEVHPCEELGVGLERLEDIVGLLRLQTDQLLSTAVEVDEVHALEHLVSLDDGIAPVHDTALQVERILLHAARALAAADVLHENDVQWCKVFGLDRVESVDAGQHRPVLGLHDVVNVLVEHIEQGLPLVLQQRLENEPLVMRKEEEAARLTLRLAGLEDAVAVLIGGQRDVDLVRIDAVKVKQNLELFHLVSDDVRPNLQLDRVHCANLGLA
jgi:hypothetical protein